VNGTTTSMGLLGCHAKADVLTIALATTASMIFNI
jgi:hypothetical protein